MWPRSTASAPPRSSAIEVGTSTPTTWPTGRPCPARRSTTAACPSTRRRRCWRRPTDRIRCSWAPAMPPIPARGATRRSRRRGRSSGTLPSSIPRATDSPRRDVQASLTVATLQGTVGVVAGLSTRSSTRSTRRRGHPSRAGRSSPPTACSPPPPSGSLYGTGSNEIVEGGDQTAGYTVGRNYQQGGHLRILNGAGESCATTRPHRRSIPRPPSAPSSPAGPWVSPSAPARSSPAASDTDTVKVFDTDCDLVWSQTLRRGHDEQPGGGRRHRGREPAGRGGDRHGLGGSVRVLDGATGATVWEQPVVGRVIGSVVVANLSGPGTPDVLVPTTVGLEILDGASGAELTVLSPDLGFQNSPLVTDDPNGDVGITVAGSTAPTRARSGTTRSSGPTGPTPSDPARGRCSTTIPSAPA